jgi:hypothetical protein
MIGPYETIQQAMETLRVEVGHFQPEFPSRRSNFILGSFVIEDLANRGKAGLSAA